MLLYYNVCSVSVIQYSSAPFHSLHSSWLSPQLVILPIKGFLFLRTTQLSRHTDQSQIITSLQKDRVNPLSTFFSPTFSNDVRDNNYVFRHGNNIRLVLSFCLTKLDQGLGSTNCTSSVVKCFKLNWMSWTLLPEDFKKRRDGFICRKWTARNYSFPFRNWIKRPTDPGVYEQWKHQR